MIRPCWITLNGEVILCPNSNDHMEEAARRFPGVGNPERVAEKAGWIKITGWKHPPSMIVFKPMNQAQIDALERHSGKYWEDLKREYPDYFEEALLRG